MPPQLGCPLKFLEIPFIGKKCAPLNFKTSETDEIRLIQVPLELNLYSVSQNWSVRYWTVVGKHKDFSKFVTNIIES